MFSASVEAVLHIAFREAVSRRHAYFTLEHLLYGAIRGAGLPVPTAQYAFPGRQAVHGCVDAAYPAAAVAMEADGRRWHARRADLRRVRLRDNEAVRAGWSALRFMAPELRHDLNGVADTITDTLERRRMQPVA